MKAIPFLIIGISAGLSSVAFADAPPVGAQGADEITPDQVALIASPTGDEDSDAPSLELEEAESESSGLPFSARLSVDTSTTAGTLVYQRDCDTVDAGTHCDVSNSVAQNYGLGFGYSLPLNHPLTVGLNFGFSKFLTRSGGSQEIYEGRFQDTVLSIADPQVFVIPVLQVGVSANLSAALPTSKMSQFARLYLGARAGVGLSRTFGDFTARYSGSYGRNFNEYTTLVFDQSDLDAIAENYVPPSRPEEHAASDALLLDSGMLTQHTMTHTLAVSYRWLDAFNTSVSFTRSDAYSYSNAQDNSDPSTDSEFSRATRRHDLVIGTVSQSYGINDHFSVAGLIRTVQTPLSADNQSVNFPFWDTQTSNLSRSSFLLNLTASY